MVVNGSIPVFETKVGTTWLLMVVNDLIDCVLHNHCCYYINII